MKGMCGILAFLVGTAWAVASGAAIYESELGYSVELPSGWAVLSKDAVRDKPEWVEAAMESVEKDTLKSFPQEALAELKELFTGGKVDYFYRTTAPRVSVTAYRGTGAVPEEPKGAQEVCSTFSEELSRYADRTVHVYTCKLDEVHGRNALYVVADDYTEGERYLQYQVNVPGDKVLIFTANSKDVPFEKVRQQFMAIVQTVRLQ